MGTIFNYEYHHDNPLRRFYLNPVFFDKWFYQNKGEYMDYVEGTLLDNYLIETKRGIALVSEHYLNPNLSDYLVTFCDRRNETAVESLFEIFDEIRKENESWF